jgi:[ribosomal protein S5]-alanine N-acetyltransferase
MNFEISGQDFLDFKCPYCGMLNSFPTTAAKLPRECLNCQETFLVPEMDQGTARALPLPFESERIRLRRFEPTDWQDLLEFKFEEEDDATGWLLEMSKSRFTDIRRPFYLAIQVKETGKVAGSLDLRYSDEEFNQMELSWSSVKPEPLPGFTLEALEGAFEFCFRELHLHRVFAQCLSEDAESQKLFKEAGMRQEAEFLKNIWIDGKWQTTLWFAMLEDEYLSDTPEEK